MNWIESLSRAISYIESHLTDAIDTDEVSREVYSSSSHFQLIFHIVMGLTIGEYIRNRRLSLAAQDILSGGKISDVATRYQYESPESFSKAFTRFHGTPPSKIRRRTAKFFHPLTINISIQGGFDMSRKLIDEFYWSDIEPKQYEKLTDAEKYRQIVGWAGKARATNPLVFNAVTEWILDDSEWTEDKLAENEQILLHGVLARFKEQNAKLRALLKELEPSGVVNDAVFKALDRFDAELSGVTADERLSETVSRVFADFSAMRERDVRRQIAGNQTNKFGTINQGFTGYVNWLKDCDAGVQWALFMPDMVKHQQNGFQVDSFEYITMPAMRFIGQESEWDAENNVPLVDREMVFGTLDTLAGYKSGFDYDVCLTHHYGKGVDVERNHDFWGRFFKADTPMPEGFVSFDFVPDDHDTPYLTFRSQFAFAKFSGDMQALHSHEGYDVGSMYDVTRNIMLGQCVTIPYPEIYWTAEVFTDGYDKWSTAFMFSAEF